MTWVAFTFACVLVGAEHAAGNLPVQPTHGVEVFVGRVEVLRVLAFLGIDAGFIEGLGYVDIVPVGQGGMHRPVHRASMVLFAKFDELWVAGDVVKPEDARKVVGAANVLPVAGEEFVIGNRELVVEVIRHQVDDAVVAGGFVRGA